MSAILGKRRKHARFYTNNRGSIYWALWCGYCERDHMYSARMYGRDVAENSHDDHMDEMRRKA